MKLASWSVMLNDLLLFNGVDVSFATHSHDVAGIRLACWELRKLIEELDESSVVLSGG